MYVNGMKCMLMEWNVCCKSCVSLCPHVQLLPLSHTHTHCWNAAVKVR